MLPLIVALMLGNAAFADEPDVEGVPQNGNGPSTDWLRWRGPHANGVADYALMDNGVLVRLDGKTGKEIYRTRLGGACNSSPIAGGGHVYLSDTDGTTFVVKAGREFESLATNSLGERITASPAVSGDELFYRTDSHVYCIAENAPG